jgi:hypothetical protein
MVARNSELRMNGLPVGSWHDIVDPERSRMEIVEAFMASIPDNAMQHRLRETVLNKSKRPKRSNA